MSKIGNSLNLPASSSSPALTLGNGSTYLGNNILDCKGSAAFGTFAGTAAPSNGLLVSGIASFGNSSPASTAQVSISPAISATLTTGFLVNPTYTGGAAVYYGELLTPAFNPPNATTYGGAYGSYISPTIAATGTGAVTVTAGLYVVGPAISAGTVVSAYGLYVSKPTTSGGASTTYNVSLFSDNIVVGLGLVNPPTGGMIVQGHTLIGTGTDDGSHYLQVSGSILGTSITLTSGATNNYVLTSDGSGNGTWQAPGSSGVSSITGTANQIAASASTGAVTLSLTDGISVGASYVSTSPPTSGIIVAGLAGFGTSSPASTSQVSITPSISATLTTGLLVNPTYTNTSGTLYGEQITPAFNPPTGDTYTAVYGSYIAPTITPAGTGKATTAYGLFVAGPVVSANTTTTAYGIYAAAPSGAGTITHKAALYADNASVGFTAITPPTNGLIVSGSVGIGTSGPSSSAKVSITPSISSTITTGLLVNPTFTNASGTLYGAQINAAFNPPTGDTYTTVYGAYIAPTITPTGTGTATTAVSLLVAGPTNTANTITNAYGIYVQAPSAGGGTITNSIALYADNISIGYTINTPPTSGLIVFGNTLIGTATDDGVHNLQVNGSIKAATIQLTTGATNGYVLESDASGNGSWQPLSGIGVTSITGTAAQITASASTGAVTLSLPSAVGIGTTTPNASAALQVLSTTQGVLIPSMTTTQKNAISSPATNLQVFDSTLGQMQSYQTITTANVSANSGTTNTTLTSASQWFPFLTGQFTEVAFSCGTSTANWSSSSGISTTADNFSFYIYPTGGANGSSLIYTFPNNPSIGVYMIEWTVYCDGNSAIIDFSFNVNGGSFTTVRSQFTSYLAGGNLSTVSLRDFITITTGGQACTLKFLANGHTAGSGGYYVHMVQLRITRLG